MTDNRFRPGLAQRSFLYSLSSRPRCLPVPMLAIASPRATLLMFSPTSTNTKFSLLQLHVENLCARGATLPTGLASPTSGTMLDLLQGIEDRKLWLKAVFCNSLAIQPCTLVESRNSRPRVSLMYDLDSDRPRRRGCHVKPCGSALRVKLSFITPPPSQR
jgi:hypothetical protein